MLAPPPGQGPDPVGPVDKTHEQHGIKKLKKFLSQQSSGTYAVWNSSPQLYVVFYHFEGKVYSIIVQQRDEYEFVIPEQVGSQPTVFQSLEELLGSRKYLKQEVAIPNSVMKYLSPSTEDPPRSLPVAAILAVGHAFWILLCCLDFALLRLPMESHVRSSNLEGICGNYDRVLLPWLSRGYFPTLSRDYVEFLTVFMEIPTVVLVGIYLLRKAWTYIAAPEDDKPRLRAASLLFGVIHFAALGIAVTRIAARSAAVEATHSALLLESICASRLPAMWDSDDEAGIAATNVEELETELGELIAKYYHLEDGALFSLNSLQWVPSPPSSAKFDNSRAMLKGNPEPWPKDMLAAPPLHPLSVRVYGCGTTFYTRDSDRFVSESEPLSQPLSAGSLSRCHDLFITVKGVPRTPGLEAPPYMQYLLRGVKDLLTAPVTDGNDAAVTLRINRFIGWKDCADCGGSEVAANVAVDALVERMTQARVSWPSLPILLSTVRWHLRLLCGVVLLYFAATRGGRWFLRMWSDADE